MDPSEFLSIDRNISLEGLGLLGFVLAKPSIRVVPRALTEPPRNLTQDEAWTLIVALLDTLRISGAVLFPDEVSPGDEAFAPKTNLSTCERYSQLKARHIELEFNEAK